MYKVDSILGHKSFPVLLQRPRIWWGLIIAHALVSRQSSQSPFTFQNEFNASPGNFGSDVLALRATVWCLVVAACLRTYCHKTCSNQIKHTAAVCWADRVSHSEHLLSAMITALCGKNTHWVTPTSQLVCPLRASTHTHTHAHISAYKAACVPTANALLHAQPRKLCHFIFVPVAISHVFSGCGLIILCGACACGPSHDRHNSQKTRELRWRTLWVLSWFGDEASADISSSFS